MQHRVFYLKKIHFLYKKKRGEEEREEKATDEFWASWR